MASRHISVTDVLVLSVTHVFVSHQGTQHAAPWSDRWRLFAVHEQAFDGVGDFFAGAIPLEEILVEDEQVWFDAEEGVNPLGGVEGVNVEDRIYAENIKLKRASPCAASLSAKST